LKFPLIIPKMRLNIPYEVANFKVSIVFKLWHLNDKTLKIVIYFIKAFKELAEQVYLEPNISLEGKIQELLNLLNLFMPETIKNENERSWLNRIRTSLMNKREKYSEQFNLFDTIKTRDMVEILKTSGLNPTFKQPWELKRGLPKIRTSETLLFSNEEENFDEFFIFEKGYITYFNDLEYDKFFVRSFFESYSPYLLFTILNYKQDYDFKFEIHVKNWIRLSRMFLNSILEIINNANFNSNDFITFNHKKEISKEDFIGNFCNFPLSALNYESSISKELFNLHNDLFDSPPTHFEVIESSLEYYTKAESFIRNYHFEPATRLLNEALKIFNKHRQKKAVISVLLLLRKIASLLNDKKLEQNYLQNALNIIKSKEVPEHYLVDIHYKLGKVYYKLKLLNESLNHFNTVITSLKKKETPSKKNENSELIDKEQNYLGMTYLYMGLIYLEQERFADAKINFKNAFEIGKNSLRIKLYFYLFRAIAYKKRKNDSQAIKLLTTGLNSINEDNLTLYRNFILKIFLELVDIYIFSRKSKSKALLYLQQSEGYVSTKTIPEIHLAIRWNLLMSNYYKFLVKDHDNYQYYSKQSQNLIAQLHKIGVKQMYELESD
ncbi:MAG: tetratricopeptide repeat protein, partial [Promethearchaeota archaeon]